MYASHNSCFIALHVFANITRERGLCADSLSPIFPMALSGSPSKSNDIRYTSVATYYSGRGQGIGAMALKRVSVKKEHDTHSLATAKNGGTCALG